MNITAPERLQRIIDKLTVRIDAQALLPGADSVMLTSVVAAFYAAADGVERTLEDRAWWFSPGAAANEARNLFDIVRAHETMRRLRAERAAVLEKLAPTWMQAH